MKYNVFILLVFLFILNSSCDPSEQDRIYENQQLIREKLDSIQQITRQYNADSVYEKMKDISQTHPQEFLEANLKALEAVLDLGQKTEKWQSLDEVQEMIQKFKEIDKAIKSAKSQEEVNRLNERFDSLHMRFQKLKSERDQLN